MIRRFFTRILMVVLLGFCGYNWLEMRALQAEVADLRQRQSVTDRRVAESQKHGQLQPADPADWRASAQQLEQGIAGLESAAQSPETRRKLGRLQEQTRQLGAEADQLWRKANAAAGHPVH